MYENIMEEGRKEYWRLNNELQRETDKESEEWWEATCDGLEKSDKRGRSDLLYYEMSRLPKTGKKVATNNAAINYVSGELRKEIREVKDRWKKYIKEIYSKVASKNRGL